MVEEIQEANMERLGKSGSKKLSGSSFSQYLCNPENEVTASKACSNIHRNLTDLTSQMQMMSDSLAAYKQISKYRPLRKSHDALANMAYKQKLQNLIPVIFSAEDETQKYPFNTSENVTVSYVLKKKHLSHESLTTQNSEILSDSYHCSKSCRRFGSVTSASSDKIHRIENSELVETLNLIQEELKKLKGLNPSTANLIETFSESVSHYKGCTKCSAKIVFSLPWILTRIKDLVEFTRNKRRKSLAQSSSKPHYEFNASFKKSSKEKLSFRKTDFESANESEFQFAQESRKNTHTDSGIESGTQTSTKQLKEIGKLEKIDAQQLIEEGSLGFQILLDVIPEKENKKIFLQGDHPERFKNQSPVLFYNLLLSDSEAELLLKKKRKVLTPKEISFAHSLEFTFTSSETNSFLTFAPVGRILQFQKSRSEFYLKPVQFLERQVLLPSKNFITSCSQLTGNILHGGLVQWPSHLSTNAKQTYDIQNLLANASETLNELLREARENKINAMKELEEEVKGLKDIMFKVHMNQMNLSKILLEEGLYSDPLIKLTDPNLLGEEFQLLRKTSEIENTDTLDKQSKIDTFKEEVTKVKKKCNRKLQMISTLVKGLKSKVPKEWWEESIVQAFDDSHSIEELDLAKVDEFIRQTKLFLMNTQKVPGPSPLALRPEDFSSEEEPKLRGLVGANVEENLTNLSYFDHKMLKKTDFDSILNGKSSMSTLAFPVASVPKVVDTNIRKLENQVSLLNLENERLWHEIQELKGLWEISLKQLEESRKAQSSSLKQSLQETMKSPRKTINLTIQISSEKSSRRMKNNSVAEVEKFNDVHSRVLSKLSNCLPTVKSSDSESDVNQESRESQGQKLFAKYNAKLDRRKSNYDLNFVDDSFPAVKNDKSDQSVQQFMMSTPRPSGHEIFQLVKPRDRSIPETSNGHQAKSTRKQDVQYLLQKPSLMDLVESQSSGMHATMANERELQPILENEHSDADPSACSSGSVTQAIQRLKSRVRSIHKEVTVLKSKNDRIDKLLDRLMNDAAETNRSFEKMGNSLNDLNNRLG